MKSMRLFVPTEFLQLLKRARAREVTVGDCQRELNDDAGKLRVICACVRDF